MAYPTHIVSRSMQKLGPEITLEQTIQEKSHLIPSSPCCSPFSKRVYQVTGASTGGRLKANHVSTAIAECGSTEGTAFGEG